MRDETNAFSAFLAVGLFIFAAGVAAIFGLVGGAASGGATCGNGIIEPGEECDDGNLVNGDGCTSACTVEQQCYDIGTRFSFFSWSDSYTSSGDGGVLRVFDDVVNAARYPGRVIPRFWISLGDFPFMQDSVGRLDQLDDEISNTPTALRYPFICSASNGRFPYFCTLGNHDVDGYLTLTPAYQYDYWVNTVQPKYPGTLVGIKNLRFGPDNGYDAKTTYSFDYKNTHFVILNQYHGDPTYPTPNPIACSR